MTTQDSVPPVTPAEAEIGGVVRCSALLGACVKCSKPIELKRELRPCNLARITCRECKLEIHNKATREWAARNRENGKQHRHKKGRREQRQALDKARNHKTIKRATMARLPWGVVEDVWLLENAGKKTEVQLAEELGRSMKAIEARLWRLRKAPNAAGERQPAENQKP